MSMRSGKACQQLGRLGEDLAVRYLEGQGYEIIERNFRTPFGEWDIVARIGRTYVLVEVRTTRNTDFIHPVESLSLKKRQHLLKAARLWQLARVNLNKNYLRLDLITIVMNIAGNTAPEIRHIPGFLTE